MIIPPLSLSIGVFTITQESNRTIDKLEKCKDAIETKLSYKINNKFEYVLSFVANMKPVHLEIKGDSLKDDKLYIRCDILSASKWCKSKSCIMVEKTIQVTNPGDYKAR